MNLELTEDFYDFSMIKNGIGKENYKRNVKLIQEK